MLEFEKKCGKIAFSTNDDRCKMFKDIKFKNCIISFIGSAILAFGLYNIHSFAGVTEGGALGATLLLQYWFSVSPAVSSLVFNIICYAFGWKTLGRKFLIYSAVSTIGFSAVYKVCECFEPLFPWLSKMPLIAAIMGAVFVGVGVGLCVRMGGAPTGDDALAMALSKLLKTKIQWIYLVLDIIVLGASLTYLPLSKIGFSLISVILSGQIVGFFQNYKIKKEA